MAHQISFTLPEQPLGRVDAEFKVKIDEEILGTLKISKGTVDWTPKGHSHENPYQLTWTQFDTLMRDNGKRKL